MGDDFLLDGISITIDGKIIPVSELDLDWNFNPVINATEGNIPDFIRDIGEITFSFKMSKKTRKKLYAFIGSSMYKPSRMRSAIGLKRRKVK